MKARQNPLSKFEKWMERVMQAPFAMIFPSRLEPAEVARRLELAMEDGALLQGAGHWLVPNVYDIYVSIDDHQRLVPIQGTLIAQWQESLINYARHRHYTLKTQPVLRLHSDRNLRLGGIRIDAKLEDTGHGIEATQALSAEQLAQLRAQLLPGQDLPGIANPGSVPPNQSGFMPPVPPTAPVPRVTIPSAQLTIQLPQNGQQIYRIEKPVVNIGRQLSNDIIVEDKRVSRNHAQIKYQADGQFAIFDLGSTNGITINGTPHMRQHVLQNGDRFTIGSYDFYFQRG